MSRCYKYRCGVCGSPSTSTRRDARLCRKSSCSHKARKAAARGEEYTPAGKPTTDTLRATLAEHPDLLRPSLKAKHPLTLLAPTSGPDPFPISDRKTTWLVTCSLGAATLVAIRRLQAALVERHIQKEIGVLVCKSFTARHLKACRKRGIIPIPYEARWLTMPSTQRIQTPHTMRICEKRTAPSTTVMPPIRQGAMVVAPPSANGADVGAKVDKESLLKQESLAWATNYDRCGRCATAGDAQVILICASCRRSHCKSCMSRDAEGYWRCRRCAGKVKQADTPILPWIEEPISEQRARAKGDAKDARALIRVIRCACGWGFNSQLEQGVVECRCGRAFCLADAKRIVATVQPKGRSVSARQGRVDALCRPS
jgi:hypothetical protein